MKMLKKINYDMTSDMYGTSGSLFSEKYICL